MSYTEFTPKSYPLKFAEGADWIREITVTVDDDDTLKNFTGMTAKAQVRTQPNSGTIVATFSSYDLSLFLTEGKIKLVHFKEDHTSVTAAKYWWDCILTDDEGNEIPVIYPSEFEVYKNVTTP